MFPFLSKKTKLILSKWVKTGWILIFAFQASKLSAKYLGQRKIMKKNEHEDCNALEIQYKVHDISSFIKNHLLQSPEKLLQSYIEVLLRALDFNYVREDWVIKFALFISSPNKVSPRYMALININSSHLQINTASSHKKC